MNNIPPESADDIRRRIQAAHRLTRRARIEAMESEVANLKATVAIMWGRVQALKEENAASDATTIKIRRPDGAPLKARRESFLD